MSEEKTHPEHNYSVPFVTKVGKIRPVSLPQFILERL